jgi:hypothetical protein
MLHMLTSPECILPEETLVLKSLPKRTCGKLEGKVGQKTEGWGLHFQEARDFRILFGAVLVGIVASMLFVILWSYFKHDLQGASGIASYSTTVITVVIALVALAINS